MTNEYDHESVMSIGLGIVLGGLVILYLNYYPGEPFDYSIKEEGRAEEVMEEIPRPVMTAQSTQQDKLEVEKAARALRVDKLQAMLGLEEEEIQKMIATAKRDALSGKVPSQPVNYMAWIDRFVYLTFGILLCYFAYRDYNLNVFDLFAHVFPAEAATLRQLNPF